MTPDIQIVINKRKRMNFLINRKVLITMLFTGLSMLGFLSYRQLPVELFPNATLPMLFISVGTPMEVDPKYMENQAIIPLEGAAGSLEGVEEIASQASAQQGIIRISFTQDTDIKYAYLKLIEKVDAISKTLPEEFIVQALKFDTDQLTNVFMTIQVRGTGGVDRVRQVTDREIIDKIANIDGIANAMVSGGRQKSVEIVLDRAVCEAHNISPSDVQRALRADNMARTFAGRLTHNNRLYFVNVVAEYNNLNDLNNLVINKQDNLKLSDIATVNFGVKEQTTYSRVNGMEAVTINLTKDSQSNIIDLANNVKKQIALLNQELEAKEIELVIQNNSAQIMEDNINAIIQLALVGGILAIFVLWIFLRNLRLVIAIALAIPISVYTAFNFFYAAGITINSLTLLGMALAIGMLLDNSVVVLENIYRLASRNVSPSQAVVQGTREVWRSIFAATLTTITVFLPFVFSTNFFIGLIGEHIGVSIISTLLVSLMVALLLVPAITHTFLSRGKQQNTLHFENLSLHNRLVQIYLVLLKTCMRHPGRTIMGALGVFFAALLISLAVSFTSTQEAEIKELTLYVTMPGGSTLDNTDRIVAEAEKKLAELEEKEEIISRVEEGEATLIVKLNENYRQFNNRSIPAIKNEILNLVRDLNPASFSWDPPAQSRRFSGGGGGFDDDGFTRMLGIGSQQEKIIIRGQDFDKMEKLAHDLRFHMNQFTTVQFAEISLPDRQPELLLGFDKQLLALYNIPVNSVLAELNAFQPQFASGVTFKENQETYEIVIQTTGYNQQNERNLNDLKALPVKNSEAAVFELRELSSFNFADGHSTIKRTNQEKQLELIYQFTAEVIDSKDLLQTARTEVDELMQGLNIPAGLAIEVVHEDDSLGEFAFLIIIAIVLIYMILSSVFESFATPVVMMFSIPMAAIGSLLLLILTGTSLMNSNVLTGFLILLGIVVNNGIILIDYTRILRTRGYSPARAQMMAGLARVRPILITVITTIIALIPLALGKSEYVALIGVPFAITIIGGLTLSTLLTLVFIPTLNAGLKTSLEWIYQQKVYLKAVMIIVWLTGTWFIITEVESRVWQMIVFILLLITVPATLYFVLNSLRKASEQLVAANEPLHIRIRNLVKIYDWDNRFVREWKSGIKIRRRLGIQNEYNSPDDLKGLIWQIPLIGFMVYFLYFHIESGFWYFILPIVFYLLLRLFLKPIGQLVQQLSDNHQQKNLKRLLQTVHMAVIWVFPAMALFLFFRKYELPGLVIPTGIIWYLAIVIDRTSEQLHRQKTDLNRLTGRFKGLRKFFYTLVLAIPLLGRKKTAFKALKGVSIDIHHGMFGLLGPNGAGKSTLMKIICGILEPSYGQITINGIDLRENREELQGLIGYLPQEFGMYENMTAWDFLNYMGILKKINQEAIRHERVNYVLTAVNMEAHKHEKIGSFSGGMKQRIGIAQILLHLPRILVVDEPTAGLDPRERIRFRNLLVELSKERIVIFSTHIIEDVASSCNKVAVVKKGEVRYLGAPIDMVKIAAQKVWSLSVPAETFDQLKNRLVVIHHIKEDDHIRLRCLANEAPTPDAQPVKANLEDAYLYLLSDEVNSEK